MGLDLRVEHAGRNPRIGHMKLVCTQVIRCRRFRRALDELGKVSDRSNVGMLIRTSNIRQCRASGFGLPPLTEKIQITSPLTIDSKSITLILKGECEILLQLEGKSDFIHALKIMLLFLRQRSMSSHRFALLSNTIP